MAIEVMREPAQFKRMPYENCCFCRQPTSFWYVPKDVPCCPDCAARADKDVVPSKDVWIRRERIASRID